MPLPYLESVKELHQKAVESRLSVNRGDRRRARGPFHQLRKDGSKYGIIDLIDHRDSDSIRSFFYFIDFTIFIAILRPIAELDAAQVESPGEQRCKSFGMVANGRLR